MRLKTIVLMLCLAAIAFGQTTKKVVHSDWVKTGAVYGYPDSTEMPNGPMKVKILQNADTSNAAHNRITQLGAISVLENEATGNGVTNDSLGIANTIAQAPSGGTVVFPAGTYYTGQIKINKPLNFIGLNGATIKARDSLNTALILVTADNVTIKDLIIDGNRSGQTPDTTNNASYDTHWYTHGIKVLYDTSTGAGRKNFKLINSTIKNTWDNGLYLRGNWLGTSVGDTAIDGIEITGNTFDSVGQNPIFMRDVKNVKITGNTFHHWDIRNEAPLHTVDGIAFFSSNYKNVDISNNFFEPTDTCDSFGIELTVREVNTGFVFSNNVLDGKATGVSGYLNNAVLSGNVFRNGAFNHRSGFELVGDNILVDGNFVEYGVIAVSANTQNVRVTNNVVVVGDTNSSGIAVGEGRDSNIVIQGNTIDLSRSYNGVGVNYYGAETIAQSLTISDNLIFGNSTSTGIRLRVATGSDDISITGNRMWGVAYGLFADSTGLDTATITVERNDFRGSTTPVLQLDQIGDYTYKDNYPTYVNDAIAGFFPLDADSLKMWYTGASANYGTYYSDSLTSWSDLSGNNYLLQGGGQFLDNQVNGLPAVLNPRLSEYPPPTYDSSTSFTLFAVVRGLSEGGVLLGNSYLADSSSSIKFIGGKIAYESVVGGVGDTVLSDALATNSALYNIFTVRRSANSVKFYHNGVLVGSGTTGSSRPFIRSRMDGLDSTYVAEMFLYNVALSDSLKYAAENYLNDKYLLTTNLIGDRKITGTTKTDSLNTRALVVTGGTLGAAKVLTDVSGDGNATWQSPASAPSIDSTNFVKSNGDTMTAPLVFQDPTSSKAMIKIGSVAAGRYWDFKVLGNGSFSLHDDNGGGNLILATANADAITFGDASSVVTSAGNFSAPSVKTTMLSAALTDGVPTASEINTATSSTPSGKGAGWEVWIKDTNGTGLMYRVVSDGTSWWTYAGTVAP